MKAGSLRENKFAGLLYQPFDFLVVNDEGYRSLERAFPGFVYVIQCEASNAVKVGVGRIPSQRLAGLQTGSPNELSLEAVIATPDSYKMESFFHKAAKAHRLRGEWFDLSVLEAVEILLEIALRSRILIKPITHEPWPLFKPEMVREAWRDEPYIPPEERRARLRRKLGMD